MSRSEPLRLPSPAAATRSVADGRLGVQQLAEQQGAPRGLRGGVGVLRQARSAYLTAEWSGAEDRRPQVGLLVHGRL